MRRVLPIALVALVLGCANRVAPADADASHDDIQAEAEAASTDATDGSALGDLDATWCARADAFDGDLGPDPFALDRPAGQQCMFNCPDGFSCAPAGGLNVCAPCGGLGQLCCVFESPPPGGCGAGLTRVAIDTPSAQEVLCVRSDAGTSGLSGERCCGDGGIGSCEPFTRCMHDSNINGPPYCIPCGAPGQPCCDYPFNTCPHGGYWEDPGVPGSDCVCGIP